MPHEREPRKRLNAKEAFGLTEDEKLNYRISDSRFQELFNNEETNIHSVQVDVHRTGSFLFVTMSREIAGQKSAMTFYGLGFHEQREHWIVDEWYWYENNPIDSIYREKLSKTEAKRLIQEHHDDISDEQSDTLPSERARLFALIAELTDEDSAIVELEDMDETAGFADTFWFDEDD